MNRSLSFLILGIFALVLTAHGLRAEENGPSVESRLRDSLRSLTQQLRTAQSDLAAAQTAQAALTEEKKNLTAQLDLLRKQAISEKTTADKNKTELSAKIAEQTTKSAEQGAELVRLREELKKSTEAEKSTQTLLAQSKEKNILLERRIADRERKNLALFLTANEILGRYEAYSLGKALVAKEPFIGRTRVILENQMQDMQDKISDNRVRAEP